jgi:type VI protein secretion system component Hcp
MKTLLYSLFATVAVAGSGLAQSTTVTVTLLPAGASQCVFTASAVALGITANTLLGKSTGPISLGPVTFTKAAGLCSSSLVIDSFRPVASVTLTLSLSFPGVQVPKPTLTYTLTNALVTSIKDQAEPSDTNVPSETVVLTYSAIRIADLVDNTIITCSTVTNTCN